MNRMRLVLFVSLLCNLLLVAVVCKNAHQNGCPFALKNSTQVSRPVVNLFLQQPNEGEVTAWVYAVETNSKCDQAALRKELLDHGHRFLAAYFLLVSPSQDVLMNKMEGLEAVLKAGTTEKTKAE